MIFFGRVVSQTVADKIVQFSLKNMGRKVDRGECWDLAAFALNHANAQWESPHSFGSKVDIGGGLQPGDVLQFTSVQFVFPNGSASFPKHTAIVYKASKSQVTLFHQNFNRRRYVDTLTIRFDQVKSGKIEAFRPQPKP